MHIPYECSNQMLIPDTYNGIYSNAKAARAHYNSTCKQVYHLQPLPVPMEVTIKAVRGTQSLCINHLYTAIAP